VSDRLRAFVRESNRIEGIKRAPTEKEIAAHRAFLALDRLTVQDVSRFVREIAAAPLRCRPGMDVRVGHHAPPRGGPHITDQLAALLVSVSARTIDSFAAHIQYETLHPYMDGNGRSGRAIWLWLEGGLAPIGFLHRFYNQTLDASQRK